MRSFAFFWRLVPEKGFDLLMPFFDSVISSRSAKVAVFWDGELRDPFFSAFSGREGFYDGTRVADGRVASTFDGLPSGTVAYFGRRNFPIIAATLAHVDVSLMPSTFLETFGLSALESLSLGVPVAGFSKGGIVPFLLDDALRLPENGDFLRSLQILANAPDSVVAAWKAKASGTVAGYTQEAFLSRLRALLPAKTKKILLVTDFVGNIGGIEAYVKNLSDTLVSAGYEVRTVGKNGGFSTRLQKAWSTLVAFGNYSARSMLRTEVSEFAPDVVWCHSVLRRFWAVWLEGVFAAPAFRVMTYHDLWYFAPFAASCRSVSDVPKPGFFRFLGKTPGLARKIFAVAKFLKLHDLFAELSRFELHLVPSDFMLPFVRDRVPESARVETLPHYVVPACKP